MNTLKILNDFKTGLNNAGKESVLVKKRELKSDDLTVRGNPEAYTRTKLIDPLITLLDLKQQPEVRFEGISSRDTRKVDYYLRSLKQTHILMEAKPFNADLRKNAPDGALMQIKGLFRLAETQANYKFGIATDGKTFIFTDNKGNEIGEYNILENFVIIDAIINEKSLVHKKIEKEEISKKFYDWYQALLMGGRYKNHGNKKCLIEEKDALINSITGIPSQSERRELAQIIIDRLIFINFLQTKKIIPTDTLTYLTNLNQDVLNEKLQQLFFSIFNTSDRTDIDPHFRDIPYLNGSLFTKIPIETKYTYHIQSSILKEIIIFLDSFNFRRRLSDGTIEEGLDPEILGYIFEKAMNKEDRSSSGAYYTPSDLTEFITTKVMNEYLLPLINHILAQNDYKPYDLLINLKELAQLKEKTSTLLLDQLSKIKVCDNACGSGAFLLSAADFLLDIFTTLTKNTGSPISDLKLRKMIITNNVFGVDVNPSAIEIAKLRLWLWLVSTYDPHQVEPLPNIEYNLRVGNSLIGYRSIQKFYKKRTLDAWQSDSIQNLLIKKQEKIDQYKNATGDDARSIKQTIESINTAITEILDKSFYDEFAQNLFDSNKFLDMKPFHWDFEFFDDTTSGFDIIIGNPPYGNILSSSEKKILKQNDYQTHNSSEIAANFIERSLSILVSNGVLGFVVANSIAINNNTSVARDLLRKQTRNTHMALFGTRPTKLFKDAEIRAMVMWGKKRKSQQDVPIFTTDAIKFTSAQRPFLFNNLHFEDTSNLTLGIKRINDGTDVALPKIGYPCIKKILGKLRDASTHTVGDCVTSQGSCLEYRSTGGYWLNALEKMPYNSSKIKKLFFANTIERDFVLLVINSSLYYLFWSTYGNLRDLPYYLIKTFPIPDIKCLTTHSKNIQLLKESIASCATASFNPNRGRVGEFKMGKCRKEIDAIDDFLGKCYDLSQIEIDFVKQYDNHIRIEITDD